MSYSISDDETDDDTDTESGIRNEWFWGISPNQCPTKENVLAEINDMIYSNEIIGVNSVATFQRDAGSMVITFNVKVDVQSTDYDGTILLPSVPDSFTILACKCIFTSNSKKRTTIPCVSSMTMSDDDYLQVYWGTNMFYRDVLRNSSKRRSDKGSLTITFSF